MEIKDGYDGDKSFRSVRSVLVLNKLHKTRVAGLNSGRPKVVERKVGIAAEVWLSDV